MCARACVRACMHVCVCVYACVCGVCVCVCGVLGIQYYEYDHVMIIFEVLIYNKFLLIL